MIFPGEIEKERKLDGVGVFNYEGGHKFRSEKIENEMQNLKNTPMSNT